MQQFSIKMNAKLKWKKGGHKRQNNEEIDNGNDTENEKADHEDSKDDHDDIPKECDFDLNKAGTNCSSFQDHIDLCYR